MSWLGAPLLLRTSGATRRSTIGEFLAPSERDACVERSIAWIKAVRHLRVDGETFRDRFTYRGDSLWWFAELFLHKEDQVARWLMASAALRHAFLDHGPRSATLVTSQPWLSHIASEAGRVAGVAVAVEGARPSLARERLRARVRARFLFWSAYWSRQRPATRPAAGPPGDRPVVAFVHGAFWRKHAGGDGEEGYIGPVLDELDRRAPGRLRLVGVGPLTNFRARRWWQGATEAAPGALPFVPIEQLAARELLRPSLGVWAARVPNTLAMCASDDLRQHASIDGLDLWPLLRGQLEGVAWLQFPWSARAMDEAAAAMDTLAPAAVLTYAEAGGWGRALMLEARRRGIPTAGLQHGFIYRHWLNYRHAPDEMQPSAARAGDPGFPRPGLTLLFDAYARRHLETAGAFPADSLVVTGSPRLDGTAARIAALDDGERERIRASVGAVPGDRVVLVATKHAQMRRVFRQVVTETAKLPGVRVVVKCHPAETGDPYVRDAQGTAHVTVAPASADLAALIGIADAVVTVNSTVALDAMAFGVPALAVDLPNNLSPFVEAGVMVGATTAGEIGPALQALLRDDTERSRLAERQRAFVREFGLAPTGSAASTAADAVLALADGH